MSVALIAGPKGPVVLPWHHASTEDVVVLRLYEHTVTNKKKWDLEKCIKKLYIFYLRILS